jgi:hypothetical protein
MKQIDIIYLVTFILSILIAAFIVWLIAKNTEVQQGETIDEPGEINYEYTEWPHY